MGLELVWVAMIGSGLQSTCSRSSRLYCSCFGSLVHALVGWFELQLVMTLMTTRLTWLRVAFDDRKGSGMFLK